MVSKFICMKGFHFKEEGKDMKGTFKLQSRKEITTPWLKKAKNKR